jgi:hypothetical protein
MAIIDPTEKLENLGGISKSASERIRDKLKILEVP